MSEQGVLFAEMELRAGDVIDAKGARLYAQDIYNGLLFVQNHSGLYVVCRVINNGSQIVYSDGGNGKLYTRSEYINYEGQGFESCLFYAIPENFKKLDKQL